MGVINKALRAYRQATLLDILFFLMCVVFAEYAEPFSVAGVLAACGAAYFVVCTIVNARSWVRMYKLSKSPAAYLVELEALCGVENGHEV